jgi:superfamily II DNA/RNA helicase
MARGKMFMSEFRQQVIHEDGCDILVITPGKLKQYLLDKTIRPDNLQFLVIDEVDKYFTEPEFVEVIQVLMDGMGVAKVMTKSFSFYGLNNSNNF